MIAERARDVQGDAIAAPALAFCMTAPAVAAIARLWPGGERTGQLHIPMLLHFMGAMQVSSVLLLGSCQQVPR